MDITENKKSTINDQKNFLVPNHSKWLVCAEKPSVAKDIAKVIGCTEQKQGYIEGPQYVVTWAVGHLIGLKQPHEHDEKYKRWNYDDLPLNFSLNNSLKVLPTTAPQFKVIKSLIHRDDIVGIVNAGDSGREGLLIQSWIYRMAGNRKPVKVLWISSFTDEAVRKGFDNLHDDAEFRHILNEGESRALLDYSFGMNYSRSLTLSFGTNGLVLSYGRCQTPLLNLVVKREQEIRAFKPVPYFNVEAIFESQEGTYKGTLLDKDKKIYNMATKETAESVINYIKGKNGKIVDYKSVHKQKKAPLLFDLTSLQITAGNKFGYTPEKTLSLCQKLYETRKILSYPRTDSKYLSSDLLSEIDIHMNRCCFGEFEPFVKKIKENSYSIDAKTYVNDKKVADHPALIPTDNKDMAKIYSELSEEEKNIFDLVVKRFLAIYYPPYLYESSQIITGIEDKLFFVSKGTIPIDMGYKKVFNDDEEKETEKKKGKEEKEEKDELLPKVAKGEIVKNIEDKILSKETKCPLRYTTGSIIGLMEKYNIGTPATRAGIVEKLVSRQFIELKKNKYNATPVGESYVSLIPDELKDEQLTNIIEQELSLIGEGKLDRNEFYNKHLKEITENIAKFKKERSENGSPLKDALDRENMIDNCPICEKGIVRRMKSKEGKIFYGCSNYKEGCKFGFSEKIFGRKFGKADATRLCGCVRKGVATPVLSGFFSESKGKEYSAAIIYDKAEGKFKIDPNSFANNNDKKKKYKSKTA